MNFMSHIYDKSYNHINPVPKSIVSVILPSKIRFVNSKRVSESSFSSSS